MKQCSKCGKTKDRSEFPRRKSSRDGLHGWCRPCYRAYYTQAMRSWRSKNPQRALEANREWVKKNPEAALAKDRRWKAANRDKMRAYAANRRKKDPVAVRAAYEKWRLENLDEERLRVATRRALTADSPELREFIGALLTEPCSYCGSTENITVDHVVPLSKGGKHEQANLAPACFSCNSSKGARTLDEWPGPPSKSN